MRKKNRYKLDRKDSDNAKGVVTEITVSYDIDADKINSVISMRQDADIGVIDLDEEFFNAEEYFDAKDS